MFIRWIYYLLSDLSTTIYRRLIGRRNYICRFPFLNLTFAQKGYTTCSNAAAKGKYTDYKSADDFYNSTSCTKLRNNVLKGDYSECPEWCHIITTGDRFSKRSIRREVIGYGITIGTFRKLRDKMLKNGFHDTYHMVAEDSCDLYCAMCRDEVHGNTITKEHNERNWNELDSRIKDLKVVHFGGTGEPLIQKRTLDFLCNSTKQDAPSLESIYLITNGLHFTEELWNKMTPFVQERIELQISIDAATKETYEKVRRGGNFDTLKINLEFIKDLTLRFYCISMCVQKDNFRDARLFIDFARKYKTNPVFGQVFLKPHLACYLPEHEDYEEFISIISDDEFLADDVMDYFIKELRESLGIALKSS